MVNCEECGSKLSFIGGYQHPIMGKKQCLCSSCFQKVNESVERWRDFVISNSFNNKTSDTRFKLNWSNIFSRLSFRENKYKKFLTGNEFSFDEVR